MKGKEGKYSRRDEARNRGKKERKRSKEREGREGGGRLEGLKERKEGMGERRKE